MPLVIPAGYAVYLGAAALFAVVVSACSPKKEEQPPQKPQPPASASAAPPPPATTPPLPLRGYFGGDFRAATAYQRLLDGKVDPNDKNLDQGCRLQGQTFGEGDRWTSPCEVRRYILEAPLKYPLATRALLDDPVGLDDFDPRTTLDEQARKKVDAAIEFLKNSEGLRKLDSSTAAYREILATSLHCFVSFPDNPGWIQGDAQNLKKQTAHLESMGMKDFQDYLFKNGGLGVSLFTKHPQGEPTGPALEALLQRTGSDMSKANILFGVLSKAGLDPKYFQVPYESLVPPKEPETHEGYFKFEKTLATLVGLKLGDKTILFDPASPESKDYANAEAYSTPGYFGLYLYVRGLDWFIRTGNFEKGVKTLQQSAEISPEKGLTYLGLGIGYENLNRLEDAEMSYRVALRLSPDNELAKKNLEGILSRTGRAEEVQEAQKESEILVVPE